MSGVKVEFFTSTGGLPGGFKEVASTFSDGNGNYDLKFKGQAHSVKLDGSSGHYELGSLQDGTYQKVLSLEHKKTQNIDWHVVPYGELITHTQNINCQGANDSMQVRGKTDFDPYTSFGYIYRTGCYDHTSTAPSVVPMGYRYYETKVIRSGVTTYVYDTVFVTESGTSFLEILY